MKITDRIHLLRIDFEIPLSPEKKLNRFVNVLIIAGEKITLVDTGVKGSEEKIFGLLRELGRDPSEIETIILSHSHPDHIGSAAAIKEITGCSIMAHMGEKDWIEDIELQNRERPVPGFFTLTDRPVKIDVFLSHSQVLKLADNLTAGIIHSPGHSKGSVNILFAEDRILFTADSVPLKNDIPNYDNYSDLIKSLQVIKSGSDYDILLTSWTPPVTSREEIATIIGEGEEYMHRIDAVVKETYSGKVADSMECCRMTIGKLGLPPFLANPLVNRAFLSHPV
jgi:glyoxylase-like metal-dependent hydrolase (beta-lactamase superfamily II)